MNSYEHVVVWYGHSLLLILLVLLLLLLLLAIAITVVYVMHVVFDIVRVMPILWYYCRCRMPPLVLLLLLRLL